MKDTQLCVQLPQFQHLTNLHPKLRDILDDTIDCWPNRNLYITSIYRTKEEDQAIGGSGIHATDPHRAVDLRIRNLRGDCQTKAEEVARIINRIWQYDITRPAIQVAIAKVHGTGPHIHLQVHDRTQRKMDDA